MPEQIELWHWLAFGALVVFLLALDLFVFHRKIHEPSLRESFGWSLFWIALALLFNAFIWLWRGRGDAEDFFTGYLVEKSLSMDNVFVFVIIFRFFRVPLKYHYRILYWGVLGAIILRLIFILAGAELLKHFHWILPLFGLFLIYTAMKLAIHRETEVDPEHNLLLRLSRRFLHVAQGDHRQHESRFFVREGGRLAITPMFLVLLVVESTDVLFAVDSVPAIFGITRDPFIVFTSNIFAILGLRALYFLLAGVVDMFRYLRFGLAAVLGFVGLKMIAEFAIEQYAADLGALAAQWGWPAIAEFFHRHALEETGRLVPPWVSLVVVVGLLAISILASLIASRREARRAQPAANPEGTQTGTSES